MKDYGYFLILHNYSVLSTTTRSILTVWKELITGDDGCPGNPAEHTVMIGGIDPEPRCWNSKSLPALKEAIF